MTAGRLLRLREHETTVVDGLGTADVRALLGSGAQLSVVPRADGRHDVRAVQIVGSFAFDRARVVITPKMSVKRLLYLFGYGDQPPWVTSPVLLDTQEDLLDVMQALYASALERALSGGVVHAYREASDRLVAPRGRIDSMKLLTRRFGVLPPIDCSFQDFTADVEPNRRMLAAANMLARLGRRGTNLAARLRALAALMPDVSEVTYDARSIRPLDVDRRFDRCLPALRLAEVILRFGSVELRDGRTHAIGLLADMNVVYEDFVAEGLRRAMHELPVRWAREPRGLYLAERRRVRVEPDVVWFGPAGAAKLVLDVKYKARGEPDREDVYQMVAYCRALGIERAVLVYGGIREERLVVRNGGPTIELIRLDPDGEPHEIEARLTGVADRIRRFAA